MTPAPDKHVGGGSGHREGSGEFPGCPRFWLPPTDVLDLSDGGFLRDPHGHAVQARTPAPLATLEDKPALALLGEPGIGKTTALEAEARRVASSAAVTGHASMHVDLRPFSSDVLLRRRIFENPTFNTWLSGRHRLFLHLDSLDEALLRIDTVANLLADELPELPTDRLSIRIACRTAVWPAAVLGGTLARVWGPDGFAAYELAPLRRQDVVAVATAEGVQPDLFLRAVFAAGVVPFAIKPLTLRLLLRVHKQFGHLPSSSIKLFRQGCLALCEEPSDSRREAGRRGALGAEQRLRVACRIAAATLLASRFAVWTGRETERPLEDVTPAELAGSREDGPFGTFDVTEAGVREVLDTGLFSSRGDGRLGWAHQSYAEYLAALYLADREVEPATILKMLRHPSGGLVPQLTSVAAWSTSFQPGVRAGLIGQEPLTLLRGDLSAWDVADLGALTASLLATFTQGGLGGEHFGMADTYAGLKHAGLAGQLRPLIGSASHDAEARRAAMLVAERCGLDELQPELLAVALDVTEDPGVRSMAVFALKRCGNANAAASIAPLARGAVGPDPRQDIKGHALALLWPNHMEAQELFPLLTPDDDNYFGSYALFMTELPQTLEPEHLEPALAWANTFIREVGHDGHYRGRTLADAIMALAWTVFERPELTKPFVDHVGLRLHEHGDLWRGTDYGARAAFEQALGSDVDRRRRFLLAACTLPVDRVLAHHYRRTGFVTADDFSWLLGTCPGGIATGVGVLPESMLELLAATFDVNDPAHFEVLYAAAQLWPALWVRNAWLLDGTLLDSDSARQLRAWHDRARAARRNERPPITPDPMGKVVELLDLVVKGDPDAWWRLNVYLALTPESRTFADDLDYLITAMPGWAQADAALRWRIVDAGERHLATGETAVAEWLGQEPTPLFRTAIAGLRALVLLMQEAPERYGRIDAGTWRRWTPVVVGLPRLGAGAQSELLARLVRDALENAGDVFVDTVIAIMRAERDRSRAASTGAPAGPGAHFRILYDLPGCWGSRALKSALFAEMTGGGLTADEEVLILEKLLEADDAPAYDHAVSLVVDASSPARPRELAAGALLTRTPLRAWPALRSTMMADHALARATLSQVADHAPFGKPFYAGFVERDLAEVYLLLVRLFPRTDIPPGRRAEASSFDAVGHLRDSLPSYLGSLGTVAAVSELRGVAAALPGQPWLRHEVDAADRAMRSGTWAPLLVKEVFATTDKPGTGLVTSAEDLLEILVKVLARWQAELHGPQNPVRALWDLQANKTWRPIDEDGISDAVRVMLQRELVSKGIIANREVEVARVPGAPIGKRTDILVNALRKHNGETMESITAVIETKGCWNAALMASLEGQLFRDYMQRLRAPVGIYLVGWFDKTEWDETDGRKAKTPVLTADGARKQLALQAAGIPTGFKVEPVVLDCHVPGWTP